MKVTVLQSVYKNDKPEFLIDCFNSLMVQTIPAEKIVLTKDGSITEELEKIIQDYETKLPLQVVGYEDNHGLAYALNYGLQFVETELVARMDSDDIACPNRFEDEINWFNTHPEGIIVGGAIKEFYNGDDGEIFERERKYPEKTNKTSKTLFKGTPIAHPTMMMKTEVLKKYKYNIDTNMNEDIDLWFRLIKDGIEIHTLQNVVLNFRITDGTFKRRNVNKSRSELKIYFKNCLELFCVTPLLFYPIVRFLSRLLPYSINKKLYFSKMRKKMFENN